MSATLAATPFFEKIYSALVSSPYVPNQNLVVEAEEGRVVLKGSVESFFQKQMAQEVIRRIDGVEAIDNMLEVNWQ